MQFVVDLATFERTVGEVFDGPGPEDGVVLSPEQLAAVGGEQFLTARLAGGGMPAAARPCVFRSTSSIRLRGEKKKCSPPEPAETFLAVTRMKYTVCHHALSKTAYELLAGLLAGERSGRAIERPPIQAPVPRKS